MFTSNIVSFKTIYQAFLILVALMILADISQAEGTDRRPGFGGAPTPVNVFIFVLDLDEVKTADQSFVANVFLEYRWQDPRLAHQDETDRVRPLHDVWNPRLLLINQQRVLKTIPELVSIAPNGEVTYRQRLWGTFSQPLNLIDFPFDKQQFKIQLAAIGYNMNEIELRSDPKETMGHGALSVPD